MLQLLNIHLKRVFPKDFPLVRIQELLPCLIREINCLIETREEFPGSLTATRRYAQHTRSLPDTRGHFFQR